MFGITFRRHFANLRGVPISPFHAPSDPAQWSIAVTRPYPRGCSTDDAFDAPRSA
jgi:hypothetical protein